MPTYRDAFPSRFLKAADLAGSRPIVTIQRMGFEDLGDGQKLVAYFVEPTMKALVLGAQINCKAIARIAGTEDYTQWSGTRFRLYESTTEFKGEMKACIRIEPVPAATTAAPSTRKGKPQQSVKPTLEEDEVPF